MARFTKNGISGKVGDLVYYIRNGKQFVKKAPRKRGKKPCTPAEAKQRLQFKKAAIYANTVQNNPELLAIYQAQAKPGKTAYNLATRDARISPQVLMIDASNYIGNPGDEIIIDACDDFKVNSVELLILDQTGEIIEEGEAVLPFNSFNWIYTTTKLNLDITGCKIIAIARDLPGNKGSLEAML